MQWVRWGVFFLPFFFLAIGSILGEMMTARHVLGLRRSALECDGHGCHWPWDNSKMKSSSCVGSVDDLNETFGNVLVK